MTQPDAPSHFLESLWDFFASVRLTVALLLTLAATSIFGTVIPQNQSPEAYAQHYGERLFRLLDFLDLFDMYRSWWFQLLLVLLTVNIVVCSINRLSATWKVLFPNPPAFPGPGSGKPPTGLNSPPPDPLKRSGPSWNRRCAGDTATLYRRGPTDRCSFSPKRGGGPGWASTSSIPA